MVTHNKNTESERECHSECPDFSFGRDILLQCDFPCKSETPLPEQ